ncbi:MAG TPA: GNAT family N-acetyltransferase [Acidimicrobiia bacterium]|nr:GNAT family N-acetyltransferase [Acidimicrobiia bacterium]
MREVAIRELAPADEATVERLLDSELGGRVQARLGEIHDVLALPGLCAWLGDRILGVATYAPNGDRAELAAMAVSRDQRFAGIGSALIEAVASTVAAAGGRELWLVTTNDNVDALRLYQRRGFHITRVDSGAIDRARELKPTIPLLGRHGIPMRDELILVRPLP